MNRNFEIRLMGVAMFRPLQNLIRGIVAFFSNLFKPKKSEYFMEYADGKAPTLNDKAPVQSQKDSASSQSDVVTSVGKPEAQTMPTSPAAEATEATQEVSRKAKRFRGKAPEQAPAQHAEAPAPAVPLTAPAVAAKALNLPAPTVTFAPDYLNPAKNGASDRRRPGANMGSFLDMARQVNPSR
jgi:hypothetical protein